MTEARPSNYWIASNALYITLNANGGPDYLLGNTASGAHILCYMKGINGLEYDAGHNYRRWPLSLTPTHFETHTEKYVYCAIPRPGNAAEMAVIVFPSEHLDIYGKNEIGRQIGSEQYYYIWLQGIISSSGVTGANDRGWTQHIDTGTLASDEAMNAGGDETWWRYSSVDDTVTFLKEIVMDAKSVFHNLKARLLVLAGHELTGVATADTSDEFVDSETLVVTPSYLKKNTEEKFLRKDQDDATPYSLTVGGNLSVGGILRAVTGYFTSLYSNLVQSTNYTGEGIADTGYRLTADDGTGSSALTVDNLHVRKKATFEELEVKKETSVAGNEIRSAAANVINRTDYIDQNGEIIGYSNVKVPWMLRKMPFLLRHKFFGRLRRVRITIDPEHVGDIKKIRCYFLAKDGDRDVKNLWRAHDLVRCQTFNISRSNRFTYIGTASQSKTGNVFWWRKAVLVSTSPVAIDDKEYHYFDVSMDDCAADSDIPCAGDHAVQFGNDSDSERMNLIIQEVNGTDAPAIKAYTGIYTYDLNKCWWGGTTRKMMLSPKEGYEFYGPSFKFVQEYGQAPASIDRGAWADIPTGRDDYAPHAQVRKCYYNDKVSHNGCYWRCVMSQVGAHWVDASGNYLTQAQYDALPADQKLLCTRRQNYVTSQPGTDDTAWEKLVDKGEKGDSVSYDEEHSSVGYAYSSKGTPEAGRDYPSDITSWRQTPPAVQKGKYLWTKDVTAYDNAGTIVYTTTYGVQYQPNDGESVEIDSSRTFIKYCRQTKSQYTGQHPADSDFSLTYPTNLGQGDYLWILNQVAYVGVANPLKSYSVSMLGIDGTNGDPGADGYTTHFAYATSADGSQNFSTTNFNGATYIGTYRDQKAADSTNYRDYVWTEWKGDKGDSVTVDEQNSKTEYVASNQGTSAPTSGWSTTIPSVPQGQFLWTRVTTVYSDGSSTVSYGVSYNAEDGANGADGTSVTITSKSVKYAVTNNGTQPADSSFTYNTIPPLELGQYLWTKTEVAYSDGNGTKAYSVSRLGTDGEDGQTGADGYTTHFAYATSADGSQNFSTTNFQGATYIGTYRDQKAADSTNYRDYVWTKWKGDPGVNGKDGWMITANPANVIITQSLNNNTSSFSSATVSFSAKKGSASATITSVGTPASSEFNVSKSGNTVVVSSPKKHGNPAEYYSEGSFTVTINVTDPDTGSTVSFSVTVLCYANLLGTWKESVEAGTKTEVARSLTYGYDPEAGEVIPIENFGSFIKSSEENISTISRQINDPTTGLVTQISTIDQKADRISLSVESKENVNLVPDPDIYQMLNNGSVTRDISLVEGRTYTLTARLKNISSASATCNITINTTPAVTLACSLIVGEEKNFHQTFTPSATDNYTLTVLQRADVLLEWLQIEQGSSFTKHDNIGSAFQRTGIDIENGTINLQADKVTFSDSNGGNTDKIWIDPTYGTLHAVGGDFSGKITATDGTIGGFVIGSDNIHSTAVDSSSSPLIQLNDDGSARIGGLVVANNGDATLTGTINATSGNITGDINVGPANGLHMLITPNDKEVTIESISYLLSKGLQFYNGSAYKGGIQFIDNDVTLYVGDDCNVKVGSEGFWIINPGSTYNYMDTHINNLSAWMEWKYNNNVFLRLGVAEGKIYGLASDKSDFRTYREAMPGELYLDNGFLKIK